MLEKTLVFIVQSAAQYNVENDILGQELQQLGLPTESAFCISRLLSMHQDGLRMKLHEDMIRVTT